MKLESNRIDMFMYVIPISYVDLCGKNPLKCALQKVNGNNLNSLYEY